jgi:hypothetical protein
MGLTRRSSIVFVLLLSFLLAPALVSLPFISYAHVGLSLRGWASIPPTIDGVIDEIEWQAADRMAYMTTGGVEGVFYVMNDATNLYISVVTNDSTLSMDGAGVDRVWLYFDNDHDGVGPEEGDDIIGWNGYLGEGFKDGFSGGTYTWRKDTDYGGISDGAAAATNNGTHNHFEIVHPLDTVDDTHDFSLSMSDIVGFAVRLTVDGVSKGWWPSDDPSSWRNIAIYKPVLSAWAANTPLIDGKLNPAIPSEGLPAEWDDAEKIDFVLSWGAEVHNASLYVMNDRINLYLAFEIKTEDLQANDRVMFNFDNDHDGVKAFGDDQLFVEGWNFFQDAFFPTPAPGPSLWDVDGAGVNDGVGAVQFTGETSINGSYVFEVAHPLNTTDDDHDFSLSPGDSVGFNVLYLDGGGVIGSDGWPTFTQDDWSQMAEIRITAPPCMGAAVNMKITKVEITQAIQWFNDAGEEDNSLSLARGKSTAVRVYVDVGPVGVSVPGTSVYLYATDGTTGMSLVDPRVFSSNGPLVECFEAPILSDRGNASHTANFILPDYWVTRGSLTLVAFVKAPDAQRESDYTDNWMNWQTFSFTLTKSLKIGYYKIDYRPTAPDENPNLPSPEKLSNGVLFFEKVTPMPDLSDPVEYSYLGTIIWDGPNFTNPDGSVNRANQRALLEDLAERWEDLRLRGETYDQICGLYANAITRIGRVLSIPGEVFIAHEDRPWSFTHEIGHNYGFPHSWLDEDNPWIDMITKNSSQTYGFDTQENWLPGEPGDTVKTPASNDTERDTKYGALMGYYNEHRWISPYEWQGLIEAFDPPAEGLQISTLNEAQSSSPGLRVSGVIYKNNTGSLRPIFEVPTFLNATPSSGPYIAELRGPPPGEPVLYSQSFNVSFDIDICADGIPPADSAFFMLNLPFMSEAYSVSLWNNTVLLDKISASSNPPSVTISYPNGGENIGNSFSVNWTASDLDSDPLTFKLFYSSDSGVTWKPLSSRIEDSSLIVDASMLTGSSQWLIRVQASDGFYTSEDQSDAIFNVPLKNPLNVAGISVGPCNTYNFGDPIILKGSAFDPEDGVLSNSSLTWTSDLGGFLGTGRVFTATDLMPGIHNITLTASDSDGNNSTYSFEVTVELHDVAVIDMETSKTGCTPAETIGQGQTTEINATVQNQGDSVESFNVTIYANATKISSQQVTLDPAETKMLTYTWDTTLYPYGNYTLTAIADIVSGEIDVAENTYYYGWMFVTIAGDIDGDGDVDIFDIVIIADAYGSSEGEPKYNAICDIDGDGDVDIFDVVIAAGNYGESW